MCEGVLGYPAPPFQEEYRVLSRAQNKIEHRYYPELDPALYGECQAMLMNFEDVLVKEFGLDMALLDKVGVALQFSAAKASAAGGGTATPSKCGPRRR